MKSTFKWHAMRAAMFLGSAAAGFAYLRGPRSPLVITRRLSAATANA